MTAFLKGKAKLLTQDQSSLDTIMTDLKLDALVEESEEGEETANLWQVIHQARSEASQANHAAETSRNESTRLKEKIQQLEKESNFLRQTALNKQHDLNMLQELEVSLNERCSIQALDINRLHQQCVELEQKLQEKDQVSAFQISEIQKLKKEVRQLDHELNSRGSNLNQKDQALQKRSLQFEKHEERLRGYVGNLNSQKLEVKKLATQLVEDLEAARTMHPLKDYLSFTEFELSKTELQLKKTPTSSQDRTKLESYLTQLIEQRDFLKSVIEESHKKLQEQTTAILKICHDPSLAPVPPPPPLPKESDASTP
jgi:hypothetical protein